MTISKSKKAAEVKINKTALGQSHPQNKKHLSVKNPPFLLHTKENQVFAGIKLEEAIFVDNKLLLRGWVLGFSKLSLLCDDIEVSMQINRFHRQDMLEMYSVITDFDSGFEIRAKNVSRGVYGLRWHLSINDRIVPIAFSLEIEKINPWQLYNQFARHQMFHLEPFNLNSLIGEHAIAHLKGKKAEASYLLGQRVIAKQLPDRPLISILVPVYQVKPAFLKATIESVIAQTYDNWELCLVDDASIQYRQKIVAILKKYSKIDKRIYYSLRKENGHICNATNDCLALAKGKYVALLDHDDLLTPDALYEMAVAINANPDLDILYSDEDKVDEWDVFFDPYYKPDWSPHTLWARMYVGHLTVYRKSLVKQVKGFRVGFEGSQDYDLLLRCSEKTNKIHHVPRVLYHWRSHSESTASETGGAAKNYCADAGRRAVEDAMNRRGIEVNTGLISEQRTAIWVKPKVIGSPLVEIIIPSRNGAEILSTCLQSIFKKSTYQNFRVTVIDNNSNEDGFFTLMEFWGNQEPSRFQAILDRRDFNFSAINNLAVKQMQGEFLLFLNNDTEVITADWLEGMLGYAQLEEVGAVGVKLLYHDNTIQHAGVVTGIGGIAGHVMKNFSANHHGYFSNLELITNYSAVTAACLMVSRKKFNSVKGFEEYLQIAFNDVDFCLKLRKQGLFNVYLPSVELYHHESKSRGYEDSPKKRERFEEEIVFMRQRWGKSLDNDPFYSPWLTVVREDMSFRYH